MKVLIILLLITGAFAKQTKYRPISSNVIMKMAISELCQQTNSRSIAICTPTKSHYTRTIIANCMKTLPTFHLDYNFVLSNYFCKPMVFKNGETIIDNYRTTRFDLQTTGNRLYIFTHECSAQEHVYKRCNRW